MIFNLWILNSIEKILYDQAFNDYLTMQQIKTIKNVTPSLVRIMKTTRPRQIQHLETQSKTFSVVGVHIHIYLEQTYTVILISVLGLSKLLFINFTKQVHQLVKSVEEIEPHFSLRSNQYFIQQLQDLNNTMKRQIKTSTSLVEEFDGLKKLVSTLEDKESSYKYLIIGTGAAGKSSIIAQFFENWNEEKLQNIKPTVGHQHHDIQDAFTNESFVIFDLGGQEAYRKKHLQNQTLVSQIRCLIYVIDVQDIDHYQSVQAYLVQFLEKMIQSQQYPMITILLHKYDPQLQEELNANTHIWLEWLYTLERSENYSHFQFHIYLTSIYDHSAREALARTFLFTLPKWFLNQTIEQDLIIKATNSLYPVVHQLTDKLEVYNQKDIEELLFQDSIPFGFEVAKLIIKDWINYLIKGETVRDQIDKHVEKQQISIIILESDRKVRFCLKCPLKEEFKTNPAVCEITHGLFEGLGQLLGFKSSEIVQSEIRDKTNECFVDLSY